MPAKMSMRYPFDANAELGPRSRAEAVALALCLLTTLQAAVLKPYIILMPGHRVNLFTALLCAASLAALIAVGRRLWQRAHAVEVIGSGLLLALALASGLASAAPMDSTLRAAALLAPALGGYWCGRLLVNRPGRMDWLAWMLCLALMLMLVAGCISLAVRGSVWAGMDANPHPLVSRLLAMSFAPLALVLAWGGAVRVFGWVLLGLGYAALFLSGLRSAVIIPALMTLAAFLARPGLRRWSLAALLAVALAGGAYALAFPDKIEEVFPASPPVYYRIESYSFAWHVAKANPWLGVGLRAERGQYLADYQVRYPAIDKKTFGEYLAIIGTHENVLLTLMAGLGLPFTTLYLALLAMAFIRLARASAPPGSRQAAYKLALFLPLGGMAAHFMLYDGLLMPQVCWFFHLLLGAACSLGRWPGDEQN